MPTPVELRILVTVEDTVRLAELAGKGPGVIVIVGDKPTDWKLYGNLVGATTPGLM